MSDTSRLKEEARGILTGDRQDGSQRQPRRPQEPSPTTQHGGSSPTRNTDAATGPASPRLPPSLATCPSPAFPTTPSAECRDTGPVQPSMTFSAPDPLGRHGPLHITINMAHTPTQPSTRLTGLWSQDTAWPSALGPPGAASRAYDDPPPPYSREPQFEPVPPSQHGCVGGNAMEKPVPKKRKAKARKAPKSGEGESVEESRPITTTNGGEKVGHSNKSLGALGRADETEFPLKAPTTATPRSPSDHEATTADGCHTGQTAPSSSSKRKKKKAKQQESKSDTQLNLKASLHFHRCYEKASEVKSLVQGAFQNPRQVETQQNVQQLPFKIKFETITLLHKSNETFCDFIISSSNVKKAKNRTKFVAFILKKTLGVAVSVTFHQSKGSTAAATDPHISRSGDQSQEGQKSQAETSVASKLEGAEASGAVNAPSKKKRKHKKTKSQGSAAPGPKSQTLLLSINKRFETSDLFSRFLDISYSNAPFKVEVLWESISISDSFTSCLIKFDSKADVKRYRKILLEIQELTHHEITLLEPLRGEGDETKKVFPGHEQKTTSSVPLRHGLEENRTSHEQGETGIVKSPEKIETKLVFNPPSQMESQIAEALESAKQTKNEVLKNHFSKIVLCENGLKVFKQIAMGGQSNNELTPDYISTFNEQIAQLKNQRQEFLNRCNVLCQALQKKDPGQTLALDIAEFMGATGIECNRLRKAHPVYACRNTFVKQLKTKQVCLISGEPGAGKSTQLVQYLLDGGFADHGIIVNSQPKKCAVMGLADQVAKDLLSRSGDVVGFKTTTSSKVNGDKTKILFTTHDCLLKDCIDDPKLRKYSCVVLDDAHVRSVDTDILMALMKRCLLERDDFRVVISLSSGNHSLFANFFSTAHYEIQVSRKRFPVEVFHDDDSTDSFENYEMRALSKAADIHSSGAPGDILVFLSTPLETMRCCGEFEKRFEGRTDFKCVAFHDLLPQEEMKRVFEKVLDGVRRVIFATDYAETSVSTADIRFVVDTGVTLESSFDPRRNLRISGTRTVCKSSAIQRMNLASCNPHGQCFRLYSLEDYRSFREVYEPEVLSSNLGVALLKLSSLGFDLHALDLFQTPDQIALKSAFQVLEYLGALKHKAMTEAGKWMLRLPYDITNNCLVYKAQALNLTYDAIVLASLQYHFSHQDIHYNDLSHSQGEWDKAQLTSKYGDIFTFLQIYRKWCGLPKHARASWCRQKNINYKFLGFIRNCVDEALVILRDELGIHVARAFSDDQADLDALRKIVFHVNIASLSHYVDNGKAGYKSLVSQHITAVHPGSGLAALDARPHWIVFTDVWRMSRERIKGITIVEEKWVEETVGLSTAGVNLAEMRQVYHNQVGPSVFKFLTGPCFGKLWELEQDLCTSTDKCIIEADKDEGTLKVFSTSAIDPTFEEKLNTMKTRVLARLQSEILETKFCVGDTFDSAGVEVGLGQGGHVTEVATPIQSRQVLVKNAPKKATVEKVLAKFRGCGQINGVKKEDHDGQWGVVEFGSTQEAMTAVLKTTDDKHYTAELVRESTDNRTGNIFAARASWCGKPLLEERRAIIKCSPLDKAILVGKYVDLSGALSEVIVSPDDFGDLIIQNPGTVPVAAIHKALTDVLVAHGNVHDDVSVSLVRFKDSAPDSKDLEMKAEFISSVLKNHIDEDDFQIQMPRLCEKSSHYVCLIHFPDPVKGEKVCREINGRYDIDGEEIDFQPYCCTLLLVPQFVKEACEERLLSLCDNFHQTLEGVGISWRRAGENLAIDVKSTNVDSLVEVSEHMSRILQGDVIDFSTKAYRGVLLSRKGQQILESIEKITKCVLVTDFRFSKIQLYGSKSNISQAREAIKSYMASLDRLEVKEFDLRRPGGGPHLTARVLCQFGPRLKSLVKSCGLETASMDLKGQRILAVGSHSSLTTVSEHLQGLADDPSSTKTQHKPSGLATKTPHKPSGLATCVFCRSALGKGEYHRLEVCSHTYCFPCLQGIVQVGCQNKVLPFACVREQCCAQFVAADFKLLLSKNLIHETDLVEAAIEASVSADQENIRFCPTVNCPVVYRPTHEVMGSEFVCPMCLASVCTSCHKPFHRGLSCGQASTPVSGGHQTQTLSDLDLPRKTIVSWVSNTVSSLYKFVDPFH